MATRVLDKKISPCKSGDLVKIEDTGNLTTLCLILDLVDPIKYLGLPEDVFEKNDPMLKEVYKVFVHGTISLINSENILEKISDGETED